ncbi:hypothetical protein [Butyricicoccus sp.]|uniref:hypothetical protein n=1 Tax=Butyricicoccus sp. TaxID=2049021 RepID=UPI003F15067E
MKLNKYSSRALAMVLALCLSVTLVPDAMAAGKGKAKGKNKTTTSTVTEDTGSSTTTTLTLVEDETTVENGEMLRASTYAATTLADDGTGTQANSTTRKYFPVTMYNYDATTINNATHQVEVDGDLGNTWDGIYFSAGSPSAESYSEEIALEDGTYIIQNARAAANNVGSWLVGNTNGITSTTNQSEATQWTVKSNGDGTYTLNSTNGYMTIGSGENGEKTATTASNIKIVGYTGQTYAGCVQLNSGSYYLCQWGGNDKTVYGGYDVNNNTGNAFYFYKVTDSSTTKVSIPSAGSRSYAAWNWWNKGETGSDKDSFGDLFYTGLVESTLTANKDIVFTKPEGGIFNSDATVKDIYTNVEMPFVYENTDVDGDGTKDGMYYTFDASQNAVYFHEDTEQKSTVAQSNGRMYFNEGTTQKWSSIKFGDGSTNVWAPFDDTTTSDLTGSQEKGDMDYHFGMRTTIPFTMTTNGRMGSSDSSEPIRFSFSGDDDVWVFIDGQLVIDLGGIHNRLNADIDFAANTITYSENNGADTNTSTSSYNDADFETTQTLFGGVISQDRTTFAATDSHELTIFYLERGAGSSNCKIQFNLPMKDTVSVTKRATQSISSDGTLSPLTAKEQETVNNIDFGFTLTKNGEPVANTNYSLLNENGQVIDTPSTDKDGKFTLRNGQTAKFVGEIDANGAEYQVVEDAVEGIGFKLPTYTYSGTAAGGYTVDSTSYSEGSAIPATKENLESAAVTAKGSTEAEDSLQFICENYFDANLPNPSSRPVDDQIVIDYGLSVVIDALANDVYRGDTIELTDVTGAQYGTATIKNGKITYQLTKQLTGVEVLTYTAKVTGSGNEGTETTTESQENTAKIYIIPATSMYYEEDFSDLVTYTKGNSSGWQTEGTPQTDPQEPGVVGTVGDSPYGSDAAYLNDSGDSNGSSKYVNTTNGSASFSYTFTGTGTSFFARTTSNSGYMRVVVKNSEDTTVQTLYRDTSYKNSEGTIGGDINVTGGILYNIPVFTYTADTYDTYTVTVTIAGGTNAKNYGKEFWLDGIRVINPLNSQDTNADTAKSAYATDGEAHMTVVTLRDKLIGEAQINKDDTISWNEGDNFVLFTDTNGKITSAEEYKSNGPKEEVYLDNGQSVTFSLKNWDANTNKIYLGIKAPVGSGTVSINGYTLNINNATDCYYDISGYANITTDEDDVKTATFEVKATSSLISVTNIKVTGNAEFTIVNQEDENGD